MNAQGALLKSCLGPLARYSTHQETMGGRLEQVYLPSDSRLDLPRERPLFELDFNKWWEGEGKMWALFQSLPRPLGKCHFLPGGGLLNIGGIRYFVLDQKGDHLYFLQK